MSKLGILRNVAIGIAVLLLYFGFQHSLVSSRPPLVHIHNDTAAAVELRNCNHGPLLQKKVNVPPNRTNDLYPKGDCDVFQEGKQIGCLAVPSERHPAPTLQVSAMKAGVSC